MAIMPRHFLGSPLRECSQNDVTSFVFMIPYAFSSLVILGFVWGLNIFLSCLCIYIWKPQEIHGSNCITIPKVDKILILSIKIRQKYVEVYTNNILVNILSNFDTIILAGIQIPKHAYSFFKRLFCGIFFVKAWRAWPTRCVCSTYIRKMSAYTTKIRAVTLLDGD